MDVAWLKERKKALGITDVAFAEALGVERSVANKVANGKVALNARRIDAVAALFGVSSQEMMYRAGLSANQPDASGSELNTKISSAVHPDQQPTRSADGGETGAVTKLDLRLPMGPGATVDDYVEEEALEFDLAYIRSFTRTPLSRLRIAEGVGDSMFPTLVSADLVWIDTTQNQLLHSDRIYAASINGGAAIKRLRPVDGGKRVLVISDNKTVDSYEVDAKDVAIWGRVIRFTRDL